jgi:hypothetical protein
MTSTEFAARYRLLKNVASRGARSFLAQQVELGRMVMVHYLDSESPQQRTATLRRLQSLQGAARQKLIEIADVDGSPVAVTVFISSFADFATWLDSVAGSAVAAPPAVPVASPAPARPAAAPPTASDFTRAFGKVDAPPRAASSPVIAPPVAAAAVRRPDPPARSGGEFTRIFGKVDEPVLGVSSLGTSAAPPPLPPANVTAPNDERTESTLMMDAVAAPKPKETRPAQAPAAQQPLPAHLVGSPAPASPSEAGSSFTAVFGSMSAAPAPRVDLPQSVPAISDQRPAERVMPPVSFAAEVERAPEAPAAPTAPPAGEFTQLFQRLSTLTPPATGGAAPGLVAPPDSGKPFEAAPRADLAPPPAPAADPMAGLGAAAPSLRPPMFAPPPISATPQSPALPNAALPGGMTLRPPAANFSGSAASSLPLGTGTPPTTAAPWHMPTAPAGGGVMGGAANAPSDFTRIMGRIEVPAAASVPQAPVATSALPTEQKPAKSMTPLIVALNVVLLLTVTIVAYFVLRK